MTPQEQIVLDYITAAAERGDKCPSNNELAFMLDCESVGTPPRVLKKLESKGLVKVERYQCARRVTIVATGKQTKDVGIRSEHWRLRTPKKRRTQREHVAHLCAEGHSLPKIAEMMELSKSYVRVLFQEIRRDLGWQAV